MSRTQRNRTQQPESIINENKKDYLALLQEPIGRLLTASSVFKGFAATPERQDCHTHSHSGSVAGNQNPYRLPPCDPYECTVINHLIRMTDNQLISHERETPYQGTDQGD